MLKHILQFVLVAILTFLPFSPAATDTSTVSPQNVSYVTESQKPEGVVNARLQNMLNHNYCFGNDFSDTEKLISNSACAFLGKIEDGKISKSLIDAFVLGMYGIDLSDVPSDGGKYEIVPQGVEKLSHTISDVTYNGDGTLTVTSKASSLFGGNTEEFICESVFFINGESAFGYNLLSCIIK